MCFGALKQHSEIQKCRGLASIDPADEGNIKQSVLSHYLVKTSQSTVADGASS